MKDLQYILPGIVILALQLSNLALAFTNPTPQHRESEHTSMVSR